MSTGVIHSTFNLLFRQSGGKQRDVPKEKRRENSPARRSQPSTARTSSAATEAERPRYSCKECNRSYKSSEALQMHVNNAKNHKLPRQIQSAKVKEPVSTTSHSDRSIGIQQPVWTAQLTALFSAPLGSVVGSERAVASQPVRSAGGTSSASVLLDSSTVKHGSNNWSVVSDSEQAKALEALRKQCHSSADLLNNQYSLNPLTPKDIAGLRKCKNCGERMKKASDICTFHPRQPTSATKQKDGSCLPPPCCGQRGRGCKQLPRHDYEAPDKNLLEKFKEFRATPAASGRTRKRRAVTLDCEMVGVGGNVGELALLCAADYMTGETLIHTYVRPSRKVTDWRTRYSGITAKAMAEATARGNVLPGWEAARAELWKYIDADTVLIGHSLHNDLNILKILHTRIVDSGILTKNAVGINRQWGLKTLCEELMGIRIQTNGRKGHDCMEDALAAREVVLWCVRNPSLLADWANIARERENRMALERLLKSEQEGKGKEKEI